MDYHGLELLWGWMLDIDNSCETKLQIECKIKVNLNSLIKDEPVNIF